MSYRIKRWKKTHTIQLPDKTFLKIRLIPYIKQHGVCIWLVSAAISRSKHQINDWMNKRKTKQSRRLASSLTGKVGPKSNALLIRQLYKWLHDLPSYDSITFRCESANPAKQFKVWSQWIDKHCKDCDVSIFPEVKAFLFYKSPSIE